MTNDMTRGNPTRLIISFTLPVLFGNLCQQLYGMVDSIIVGRAISMEALAAVGATSGISFLVIGCIQGLTAGFSVITAQRFGAGDYEGVKRSVATSALLSLAATVLLTAAGILTARPLLEVMNTPADIIEDSYAYIIVIYYGVAATAFYNLLSCIIRALGDSKTPLIFLVFASFLNVALDLLFITLFIWEWEARPEPRCCLKGFPDFCAWATPGEDFLSCAWKSGIGPLIGATLGSTYGLPFRWQCSLSLLGPAF